MSTDEDLRLCRDRTEQKLRAKVALAESEYNTAVIEYKRCLHLHDESQDTPETRLAIVQATRRHRSAVAKYSEALREFNRLVVQNDSLDTP